MEKVISVFMRKKIIHVNMRSYSESFPRQNSLNLALTYRPSLFTDALDFMFVGLE